MRMRTTAWLLVGGLSLSTPGCDPATAVVLPALIITNTWGVEDQDRDFSFESTDDGETHGSFEGTEFVEGEEVNTLTGSWAEGEVRFTTSDGTDYTGTFEDLPDRLVVASSAETLVLVRGG
ncbi:MAG: hypothetical protein U5R14_08585 [Gemmatimonadota bacterium]|nr:hypothetical protein [Gemmatimonadota bacterium]